MLFDSTLRRDLARNCGATLVVILTIVLTVMFIRTLGQAALGEVAVEDVALLLAYIALGHLPTMLALSIFIAVVATLGRMYRNSEMTIWFSSGLSLMRFIKPVLQTTWPVLLLVGALSLYVWPWQNKHAAELKGRFERRSDLSRVAPGQFQTSADGQRVFFYEGAAEDGTSGRNVFVMSSHGTIEDVTTARSGKLDMQADGRYLVLAQGQRNEQDKSSGDRMLARFDTYTAQVGERMLATPPETPPRAKRSIELVRDPTPRNLGELAWRLGLLFGAANLTLLGIGMSAANPRHASNWNLLFAVLTFFVYYNLINLTQAWVASGKTSLTSALVVAHGGAFVLALSLLWWREHSNGRIGRYAVLPAAPIADQTAADTPAAA